MKYGYFDDAAREYVIQTPKTPLPWINYLGSEDFFSLISNTGGGYSFYKDARLRRLTRYRYNNVPVDSDGRHYYIKEGDAVWSPTFLPCKTPVEEYQCRHGLGYSVIAATHNQVRAELTCFVPMGYSCELNLLKVANHSQQTKTLTLYSGVEWCLWDAQEDNTNFQRNLNVGEVEIDGSTLYHKSEFRERREHYAYYSVNTPIAGFDTDRDTFLGQFGTWQEPQMVAEGRSGNSVASGWRPMASHRIELELAAGEEKALVFVLGYAEVARDDKWEAPNVINKTPAKKVLAHFSNEQAVVDALEELRAYWKKLLSNYQVSSNKTKMDRMVNIWNQYQCMVTFNMSRSASYFESGIGRGMGFRDSCQDILGFVHIIPERARARILDIASIQLEDGSTYHQYQPLTKKGNADIGGGFNDDPLWLVACTVAYLKETGDFSILQEQIPFDNKEGSEKPLLEHLRRSIGFTVHHIGPHGLPLIGRADWNDCLNLNCFSEDPSENFQTCSSFESGIAESVFIAAMFVKYAGEYAEVCRRCGLPEEAAGVEQQIKAMKEAVVQYGWDGEWFLRAYDAFGGKVGSNECEQGKIFIEPQGFCVMAGIGVKEGLAKKALDSATKWLKNDFGHELLAPCYQKYDKKLGEITSYPPGYKENGSVFCHNNPWISIAHTVVEDGDAAYDAYKKICPAYAEEFSEIRKSEPYVYCQTIAGREAQSYGLAKNSWLTGTAAWTFVNISQSILGVLPDYDGLRIQPCPPSNMSTYQIKRKFRGNSYTITVRNTNRGKQQVMLEGKELEGGLVPLIPGKEHYEVEVLL